MKESIRGKWLFAAWNCEELRREGEEEEEGEGESDGEIMVVSYGEVK